MDCSFCGKQIPQGTEAIYVTKAGSAHYFCSSKCEKNQIKLKRNPRKVRWTESYRKEKQMRLKTLKKDGEKSPKESEPSGEPKKKIKQKKTAKKKTGEDKSSPKKTGEKKTKTKKKTKSKKKEASK
ncbi:MAG: hypothetical protein GF334_13135 [Candidatus Altiarchaeales archaeon]|nr:hypothetical protein [Candidatus Altiarchaeales archaeon]